MRVPFMPVLIILAACTTADSGHDADAAAPLVLDTIPGIPEPAIVIPDEPACPSCELRFTKVVTVGKSTPPGALTGQARVWAAADGRFYVSDGVVSPGAKIVFDSTGEYLTTIGRLGSGPGEFNFPFTVISRGPDTIQIEDFNLRRLTTYTTPDYDLVAVDQPLPFSLQRYAQLDDGVLAVNAVLRTRDGIGYPLHVLDASLAVIRSFGLDTAALLPGRQHLNTRILARAGSDRFWAARETRFAVELWRADGTFVQALSRHVPWFEPWEQPTRIFPWIAPPQPKLVSVHQDDDGLLWIAAGVPDANWQPSAGPPESSRLPGELEYVPQDYHDYYDTIVEVWDPSARRLLASGRSDLRMFGLSNGGLLRTLREDEGGNYFIDVWRVDMTRS